MAVSYLRTERVLLLVCDFHARVAVTHLGVDPSSVRHFPRTR